MECMDDAPAMRGMFFVILIPFVLWFLSLLPLLILHLVVVVIFLIIHHPLIHSYRVCERTRKRARERLSLISNPPDQMIGSTGVEATAISPIHSLTKL